MKKLLIPAFTFLLMSFTYSDEIPWTADQLYDPTQLATLLKNPKAAKPIIINTGTMRNIKSALKFGPVSDYKGMEQFKEGVAKLDKNKEIVVYCGCCKLDHCPNIGPAFDHLKAQGFKKVKILNLKEDFVFEWTNKGYPMDPKQPY